jgi:hypothetical protein
MPMDPSKVPVLTQSVGGPRLAPAPAAIRRFTDLELAELQSRLAASSFLLVDKLLKNACQELEATLFDEVAARLRAELPDLMDQILREHLNPDQQDPE